VSSETPLISGTCAWFNPQKGYGFVKGDDSKSYFVHHSVVDGPHGPGVQNLVEGERVELEPGLGERGPMARRVRVLRPDKSSEK
jgi:CspA family cold shock protein